MHPAKMFLIVLYTCNCFNHKKKIFSRLFVKVSSLLTLIEWVLGVEFLVKIWRKKIAKNINCHLLSSLINFIKVWERLFYTVPFCQLLEFKWNLMILLPPQTENNASHTYLSFWNLWFRVQLENQAKLNLIIAQSFILLFHCLISQ